jgi:hypothetical protein
MSLARIGYLFRDQKSRAMQDNPGRRLRQSAPRLHPGFISLDHPSTQERGKRESSEFGWDKPMPKSYTCVMPYFRLIVLASIVLFSLIALGCAGKKPPTPKAQEIKVESRPVVDFSKGALGLPLTTESLPPTADALVASLIEGYAQRVLLPGQATETPSLIQLSLIHI